MPITFNRIYRVNIQSVSPSGYVNRLVVQTPIEGQTDFEGLQLTANLKVASERNGEAGQQGVLSLYNLSPRERDIINNTVSGSLYLQAGYGEAFNETSISDLPTVYHGDILKVETNREKDNFVTKITLKTGDFANRLGIISREFPSNVTFAFVAEEIAKSFLVTMQGEGINNFPLDIEVNLSPEKASIVFPFGYSTEGRTSEELTKFLDQYDCTWIHYNNSILIHEKNKDPAKAINKITFDEDAIKGRVEKLTDVVGNNLRNAEEVRLRFKTFLEPQLSFKSIVNLPSELFLNEDGTIGEFNVMNYVIDLDYRGNKWDMIVDVRQPNLTEE